MNRTLLSTTLISLTLAIVLACLTVGTAFAQGASGEAPRATPAVPPQTTPVATTSVPATPAQPSARQFDRPVALRERAQARITNLAANMSTRIDTLISRYEHIIARLEARIAIMQNQGIDTRDAEAKLTTAKANLANTKLAMATIDEQVRSAVTAADGRQAWESVRTIYARTHDTLRSIHATLIDTVVLLAKAAAATTSASSSDQTTE